MSFEPRLVSPDEGPRDPGSEVPEQLPAELDALAGRLRSEAAGLADRYPGSWRGAGAVDLRDASRRRPAGQSGRWWLRVAVAAACLLLLASVGGVWWAVTPPTVDRAAVVPSDGPGTNGGMPATSSDLEEIPVAEPDDPQRAIRWQGAETLLMGVSAPELEAVLDLMESEGTEQSPLSI